MRRELTIVLLSSAGRAPRTLRIRPRAWVAGAFTAGALMAIAVWAGWQLGALTAAL